MQTPSPALLPCDLRPFPTALSDSSSFKRHINYSNEVRRDPALCHPELGTHSVSPPASSPAASCPPQLGRVGCSAGFPALGLSAAVTEHPHPLQEHHVIGSPPKVNALLAGSSPRLKARRGACQLEMKAGLRAHVPVQTSASLHLLHSRAAQFTTQDTRTHVYTHRCPLNGFTTQNPQGPSWHPDSPPLSPAAHTGHGLSSPSGTQADGSWHLRLVRGRLTARLTRADGPWQWSGQGVFPGSEGAPLLPLTWVSLSAPAPPGRAGASEDP